MNTHLARRLVSLGAHLALAVCFAPAASAATLFVDPMFGVSVTSDLHYTTAVDGNGNPVALDLDLYRPTGPGLPAELPAMVLMHGGSFIGGQKENMALLAHAFAQRGYVTASINYRKLDLLPPPPGDSVVPSTERLPVWLPQTLSQYGATMQQYFDTIAAAVADQGAAVNWLAANSATYGVNPDWIGAGGYSAGAVSSLLLGAGAVDGVTADVGVVVSMAGGMFGTEWAVDSGDPGVYVLHGTADTTVPYAEVGHLETALSAAGVPYASRILPGVGHDLTESHLLNDSGPFFEFVIGQLTLVPEPSSYALAACGIAALSLFRRRRTRCYIRPRSGGNSYRARVILRGAHARLAPAK